MSLRKRLSTINKRLSTLNKRIRSNSFRGNNATQKGNEDGIQEQKIKVLKTIMKEGDTDPAFEVITTQLKEDKALIEYLNNDHVTRNNFNENVLSLFLKKISQEAHKGDLKEFNRIRNLSEKNLFPKLGMTKEQIIKFNAGIQDLSMDVLVEKTLEKLGGEAPNLNETKKESSPSPLSQMENELNDLFEEYKIGEYKIKMTPNILPERQVEFAKDFEKLNASSSENEIEKITKELEEMAEEKSLAKRSMNNDTYTTTITYPKSTYAVVDVAHNAVKINAGESWMPAPQKQIFSTTNAEISYKKQVVIEDSKKLAQKATVIPDNSTKVKKAGGSENLTTANIAKEMAANGGGNVKAILKTYEQQSKITQNGANKLQEGKRDELNKLGGQVKGKVSERIKMFESDQQGPPKRPGRSS